jgi:tryptophan-rich sensory protein
MPPAQDETLSWVAIACGGGSWLTCCCAPIPFVGTIAWLGGLLLAIAGAIAGYMAWQNAKRAGGRTDLAMTGMVLGATRLGLTILFIGAILVMVALGLGAGIVEGILNSGH